MKLAKRNKGVSWERVDYKYNDNRPNPEKIFQELWNEWNSDKRGQGLGIAQALFIVPKNSADKFDGPDRDDQQCYDISSFGSSVCIYNLTKREQRIIATIIQWLGTNVGFGFLHEALRRSGYHIATTKKEPEKEKHRDRYTLMKELNHEPIQRRKNQRDLLRDRQNGRDCRSRQE